jgi:hypothetical protein
MSEQQTDYSLELYKARERITKKNQEIEELRDLLYRAIGCADYAHIATIPEIQKELLAIKDV